MGLFSFIGDAGKKLLGRDDPAPRTAEEVADFATELKASVRSLGLPVTHFGVRYHDGTVTVRGEAADHETREKIVLVVGNTAGVSAVDDLMTVPVDTGAETIRAEDFVGPPAPESAFHTVAAGDTLGTIAATHYGTAALYPRIFEANRPMLADADSIYPGQVLRVPRVDAVTHTVVPGDTLGKIAKKYLGDAARYGEIFEANRASLRSPDAIAVGQSLVIPVGAPIA